MRILVCLGLVSVLLGVVLLETGTAQTVLNGPSTSRAFPNGRVGPQTLVRDSGGNLYVIYRYQPTTVGWRVAIARSTNQGSTWNMQWQTGFDTYVNGSVGNIVPCMAIDSKDNLHCAWWHRPASSYTTHYNRFDATSQTWGTERTVSSSSSTDYPLLAVDQNDYVWQIYFASSYNAVLERSNLPFASDMNFSTYSPAFPGGSSSSNVDLVFDALGRAHMTYYDTGSGYAGVKHRWIDPGATTPTWSTVAFISNHSGHTARAEYASSLSADNVGNVFLIYPVDSQYPTNNGTFDTEFYIRKWDGSTQAWGNPVLVQKVPYAVWGANKNPAAKYANDHIIGGACDETTGEFYFAYRDFTTGNYLLGRWRGIDTEAPTTFARLMNASPPPGPPDYFLFPHFRGSLWPKTNRTSLGLDLIYSVGDPTAATPAYTDYFEHFPIASMSSTGAPKIGTNYPLDLNAVTENSQAYASALCMSGLTPMVQIGRRFLPLVPDNLFYVSVTNVLPQIMINFQGVLDGNGAAQAQLAIPNIAALVGVPLDGCFVTYDVSGLRAISNPWGFQITN